MATIRCPDCGSNERSTFASIEFEDDGRVARRRRDCGDCGATFETVETIVGDVAPAVPDFSPLPDTETTL